MARVVIVALLASSLSASSWAARSEAKVGPAPLSSLDAHRLDLVSMMVAREASPATIDFDGVRVQTRTTPAGGATSTTNYLVDTSGSLSHVVAETNATGALVAHYVRGDDLLAVMRPLVTSPTSVTDWQSRFYHGDHLGSVRRLTGESGAITDGYTYSAFGELLGHTGTDPQPYAFTGEPYDPNVGFQYHRARWLDPRVGRFVGVDPWRGSPLEPGTLHRYLYVGGDPANGLDPTGMHDGTAIAVLVVVYVLSAVTLNNATSREATVQAAATSFIVEHGTAVGLSYAVSFALRAGSAALVAVVRRVRDVLPRAKLYTDPITYVYKRSAVLQAALGEGSRGRVTMAVGVVEDSSGVRRTVIGTSEPNGYIRHSVREFLDESEDIVVRGTGHAEADIAQYAVDNNLKVIAIGAGRPICPDCAIVIDDVAAIAATPTR